MLFTGEEGLKPTAKEVAEALKKHVQWKNEGSGYGLDGSNKESNK